MILDSLNKKTSSLIENSNAKAGKRSHAGGDSMNPTMFWKQNKDVSVVSLTVVRFGTCPAPRIYLYLFT
jgi:hypothetical protein